MEIFNFIVGWLVGLFIVSFTLVQILIILFFGFPVTKRLERAGRLEADNNIRRNYLISLLVLFGIFVGLWLLVSNIFPGIKTGFIFGGGMALLLSLGKCGINANNLSDYIQTNKQFLKGDDSEIISSVLGK